MEQPVQVGLLFPRSGQQLSVAVSPAFAERLQLRQHENMPQFGAMHASVSNHSSVDSPLHK